MFEIQSASLRNSRQSNASEKAKTSRPAYIQKTADTFEVYSTTYRHAGPDSYEVRFLRSDDKIFAQCQCEAAQNGQPCYHVMRVYDDFYAKYLSGIGAQLLSRTAVGNLGYVGSPQSPSTPRQVVSLIAGQVFTARVPVRITVEPQQ